MRWLVLGLLLCASPAMGAPASKGPAKAGAAKPKDLTARELCDLPEYTHAKDAIVRKPSASARCGPYNRGRETLVLLHVGLTNSASVSVSRWWRTGKVLHVELVSGCVGCHGDDLGDQLRPSLFAVQVTGVDTLSVTKRAAACPPQDCGDVP